MLVVCSAQSVQSDVIDPPTPFTITNLRWSAGRLVWGDLRKLLDFSETLMKKWVVNVVTGPPPPFFFLFEVQNWPSSVPFYLTDGCCCSKRCVELVRDSCFWLVWRWFALLLVSIGIYYLRKGVCYSTIGVCVQRSTAVYIDIKETI